MKKNSFHSTIHSFCHNAWRIIEKFRQKGREMSRVSGHFIRVHTKLPILNKLSTIWQPFFSPDRYRMHRKAIFFSLRPVHTASRLCMVAGLHMPFTCHFSNVMVFTFYYTWRDVCSYSQHQCTKLSIKDTFPPEEV